MTEEPLTPGHYLVGATDGGIEPFFATIHTDGTFTYGKQSCVPEGGKWTAGAGWWWERIEIPEGVSVNDPALR